MISSSLLKRLPSYLPKRSACARIWVTRWKLLVTRSNSQKCNLSLAENFRSWQVIPLNGLFMDHSRKNSTQTLKSQTSWNWFMTRQNCRSIRSDKHYAKDFRPGSTFFSTPQRSSFYYLIFKRTNAGTADAKY